MDYRIVESHGEFAKEHIDNILAALRGGDSKAAYKALMLAQTEIAQMLKELGPVGF